MGRSLRAIPSVSDVLSTQIAQELSDALPRWAVRDAARELIAREREALTRGEEHHAHVEHHAHQESFRVSTVGADAPESADPREAILLRVLSDLPAVAARCAAPGPRAVINATGVILHTNLGRAPLPEYAAAAVAECAIGYCDLEFNLATGLRGSRQDHIAGLLARITGAPAAYVVNNNAAAVLLCLDALAKGKKVVVSRGELVEIGGSFRVPEIMERSGAALVEVGTTNRTRISDYRKAIDPDVGLLLKVHTSNFRVVGFTEEASIAELAALGAEVGVPVMYDIGSGLMTGAVCPSQGAEPAVGQAVRDGADIVTFSGDKLFGGPQAGIIVGRPDLIETISKDPLARALRIDKLTLIALAAVAAAWEDPDEALRSIPVHAMLTADHNTLVERAHRLLSLVQRQLLTAAEAAPVAAAPGGSGGCEAASFEVIDDPSEVGGGSMPTVMIPGVSLSIKPRLMSAAELQLRLRRGDPSVVARVAEGSVRLHMRTLFDRDLESLARAVGRAIRA
ncbi:MAG: L-seryl-tRNA(Sec) selenium transferase [Clostridia bacterium]|nr:L-seryl-tRNA(Sec) selenium transferase [Clostridia bacterium]